MKLKDFICTKCGECCKHIDKIDELKYLHINGVCKYLKNNECSIYNIRPIPCNRYLAYNKYKNIMTEDEFVNMIIYYCGLLKDKKYE